jgi:3-amino-5-hydroxybenzoate synthase
MKDTVKNNLSKTKTKEFPKWPISGDREIELVTQVARSGNWWRMNGTMVTEFEQKFADYHDTKFCLGVTNGTQAIELVLAALNIQAGDEVIVPAFTFISTFTAPMYGNATPVPVDVDKDTFCMLPEAFEKAITPKTKAVIPVHMAGHMCDMERISNIAKKHNIFVIEDAAHAHGASINGKKPGFYSDAATFSFQNGKIMTCGEGGAILTNSEELYQKLYLLHGVGRPIDDKVYRHVVLGTNARMNEFQAAILLAQLERLEELNKKRHENFNYLNTLLEKIDGITPQKMNPDITVNTHYMYMFYYDSTQFGNVSRNEFVENLCEEGIPAFIAYPVVSNTEFYRNKDFRGHITLSQNQEKYYLPNAEKIAAEVVWLPHYTLLGDQKDIEEISSAIIKIKDNFINHHKDKAISSI